MGTADLPIFGAGQGPPPLGEPKGAGLLGSRPDHLGWASESFVPASGVIRDTYSPGTMVMARADGTPEIGGPVYAGGRVIGVFAGKADGDGYVRVYLREAVTLARGDGLSVSPTLRFR